jgi:hypothetical protein
LKWLVTELGQLLGDPFSSDTLLLVFIVYFRWQTAWNSYPDSRAATMLVSPSVLVPRRDILKMLPLVARSACMQLVGVSGFSDVAEILNREARRATQTKTLLISGPRTFVIQRLPGMPHCEIRAI